jgi:hypothetical protein
MNEMPGSGDKTDKTVPMKAFEMPSEVESKRFKTGSEVYFFDDTAGEYKKGTVMGYSSGGKEVVVSDANGLGFQFESQVLERDNEEANRLRMDRAKDLLGNKGAESLPKETKDLADAVGDLLKEDMN